VRSAVETAVEEVATGLKDVDTVIGDAASKFS
jgi:hypothetical protein